MIKNQYNSSFFNILFGYNSKKDEEEYTYYHYLNIFNNTKTIIIIVSISYFLLGIFDVVYNDIDFFIIATIKVSVLFFGFFIVFSGLIIKRERVSFLVLLFYISALSGIIIQTYYNTNNSFYIFYSAGLLSIMSILLLMSGVKLINATICNISFILIFLFILIDRAHEDRFYGYSVMLILGNFVAILASFLNEKSNRELFNIIKLVEQTNNEKLTEEIKQKQKVLTQIQELNEHNNKLQQDLNLLLERKEQENISIKNKENLISSINEISQNRSNINDKINLLTQDDDNIDKLKQANYDLSRMLNEVNESINNKPNEIRNEQFNFYQFVKDIILLIRFSSSENNMEFVVDRKCEGACLIINDQIKLKQIFISLLYHLYNNGVKKVIFSYYKNQENLLELKFNIEKHEAKELNIDIKKTLVPTYLAMIGGDMEVDETYIKLILNKKTEKTENNKYSINLKNKFVLITDDDIENLSYLEYVIKNLNAEVIKASDGIEAISLFKEYNEKIEIVIMDVNMPGLNGNEAAKYMKEINPDIPILLVTAYYHYKEHINNGDKLLMKPFSPKLLIENISELVN